MEVEFAGKEQQEIIYHGRPAREMTKKEKQRLHRELQSYYSKGIPLLLNGKKSTVKGIEKALPVAEAGEYMRDYIQDEQGKLLGLSFDYIGEISLNSIMIRKKSRKNHEILEEINDEEKKYAIIHMSQKIIAEELRKWQKKEEKRKGDTADLRLSWSCCF